MAIGKNGDFIGSARICWKLAPAPSKPKMRISFFGIVRRLEEREALDVVPMRVSNQEREFYRLRLEFFFQEQGQVAECPSRHRAR